MKRALSFVLSIVIMVYAAVSVSADGNYNYVENSYHSFDYEMTADEFTAFMEKIKETHIPYIINGLDKDGNGIIITEWWEHEPSSRSSCSPGQHTSVTIISRQVLSVTHNSWHPAYCTFRYHTTWRCDACKTIGQETQFVLEYCNGI
jgi:hypothetical protein